MARATLFIVMAILAAILGVVVSQDDCSDRTRPVFGFFRRPASCESLKENGECEQLVSEGYCLKTCGSCGSSEPIAPPPEEQEEPVSTESTPPVAEEVDEDEKKAAEYQEKLLEQVASIEDGEGSDIVEVLPELTMNIPDPSNETVVEPSTPAKKPISCKITALDAIQKNENLTTLSQAVEALNLTKVFENPDIQYTVFAPVDDAWVAAAESYGNTLDNILENKDVLKELVFSGIISDMIVDGDAAVSSQTLESQSGAVLFFKFDDKYNTKVISRFGTETIGANGVNPEFAESMKG